MSSLTSSHVDIAGRTLEVSGDGVVDCSIFGGGSLVINGNVTFTRDIGCNVTVNGGNVSLGNIGGVSSPSASSHRSAVACVAGHRLSCFRTGHSSFICDVCNINQALDSLMFGCRPCDYDVCATCRRDPPDDVRSKSRANMEQLFNNPLAQCGLKVFAVILCAPGDFSVRGSSSSDDNDDDDDDGGCGGDGHTRMEGDAVVCRVRGGGTGLPSNRLDGALADCLTVRQALELLGVQIPMNTVFSTTFPHAVVPGGAPLRPVISNMDKTFLLDSIALELEASDSDVMLLYYPGHGQQGTGALVVSSSELLSFEDLLCLSRDYAVPFGKILFIVLDSCYAGAFCDRHRAALASPQDCLAAQSMLILAAAGTRNKAGETIAGGYFTQWWARKLHLSLADLVKAAQESPQIVHYGHACSSMFRFLTALKRPMQRPLMSSPFSVAADGSISW